MDVIVWASYWAPLVASKVGLLLPYLEGHPQVLGQLARVLPGVVGTIEREQRRFTWTPQTVVQMDGEYLKSVD